MKYDYNTHPSKAVLTALIKGGLSLNERLDIAEHIAVCPDCAEALAECGMEIKTPPTLESDILKKLETLKPETGHEKNSLFFYSMRVALATCAALFLVFFHPISAQYREVYNISAPNLSYVNHITERLQTFSNHLIMEVNRNDKKTR